MSSESSNNKKNHPSPLDCQALLTAPDQLFKDRIKRLFVLKKKNTKSTSNIDLDHDAIEWFLQCCPTDRMRGVFLIDALQQLEKMPVEKWSSWLKEPTFLQQFMGHVKEQVKYFYDKKTEDPNCIPGIDAPHWIPMYDVTRCPSQHAIAELKKNPGSVFYAPFYGVANPVRVKKNQALLIPETQAEWLSIFREALAMDPTLFVKDTPCPVHGCGGTVSVSVEQARSKDEIPGLVFKCKKCNYIKRQK